MTVERRYRERYQAGDSPWDIGRPDFNLIEVVTQRPVPPGPALDIGCGTGDNSIWLAQQGFTVVGIDSAEIALEKAKEKAAQAGVAGDFRQADFLQEPVAGAPFGFAFDRGCFHSFEAAEDRDRFARNVAAGLGPAGLWLTLAGSADDPRPEPGPPRRTAREIVLAVEPYFEIISLAASHFDTNRPVPRRAWRCLLQKRALT